MGFERYKVAFQRLIDELDPLCEKYNTPKVVFLIDAAYCYIVHGASPHNYINFEFYKLKDRERRKFLTMRRTAKVEKHFNNPIYANYFNDKKLFNETFSEFVNREWIYAPDKSDEEIIGFIQDIGKVIVKPTDLSSGKGIYVIAKGNILDKDNFCQEVKKNKCLIEEFIRQHPEVSSLNSRTVNSVRVYTLIDSSNESSIIFAALRVGSDKGDVDNYHSGGVGYPIDINTGIIRKPGRDLKNNSHLYHPSTGKRMVGYQLPNWDGLTKFVLAATKVFPQSRYIGWDVAITEDGFEMIEGNYDACPEFLQSLDKEGKRDVFRRMK